MVTHLVAWKYRADVPEADREKHRAMLRSLRSVVEGIDELTVGSDFLRGPNSYDTGLFARFRDRSVLDAYTVNPEHVEAVAFGRSLTEKMAKVDFED